MTKLERKGKVGGIGIQRAGRVRKERAKMEKTVSTTDPDAGMLRRPGIV